MAAAYHKLHITQAEGVATVRLSNPPINLLDEILMGEVRRFLDRVRSDPSEADHAAGFLRETAGWVSLAFRPQTAELMATQLSSGGQTRDGERDLEGLLRRSHG